MHDLGIDDHEAVLVDLHDGHSLGASDLRRREADSLGDVHRLEHVARQRSELVGDLLDRRRLLSQNRIAEDADVEDAHVLALASGEALTLEPVVIRAMRPRSTMRRDSPDLIVTRSSMRLAPPSFALSLM